jgi:aspartyl protease family protein
MGIQDRDYYWEKHRNNYKRSTKSSTKVKYLLFPLIAMGILWFSFSVYLKKQKANDITTLEMVAPAHNSSPYLKKMARVISLKADRQGHFRGKVLINNVVMPFLIDTGATMTVIPEKMAITARLPVGKRVKTNTAGGKVFANKTRINSLKIGRVTINNIDAQINKHLDEVLIGMNTLKYFRMVVNGKTLILAANNKYLKYTDTPIIKQPIKKMTAIKKTVTCNERNVCRTSYSNY